MKRLSPALLVLLLLGGGARAQHCSSHGYGHVSYGHGHYEPSYTVTKPYESTYAYPVTAFLGIPFPAYGSYYFGPASLAAYPQAGVPAPPKPAPPQDDPRLDQILGLVKNSAAKQDQMAAKQDVMAAKQDHMEQRLRVVEARTNGPTPPPAPAPAPAPAPTPPAKAAPAPPMKKAVSAIDVTAGYRKHCFACHQEGSKYLARRKGRALAFWKQDATRMPLTASNHSRWAESLKSGDMPPVNKLGIEAPGHEMVNLMALDLVNFPTQESEG